MGFDPIIFLGCYIDWNVPSTTAWGSFSKNEYAYEESFQIDAPWPYNLDRSDTWIPMRLGSSNLYSSDLKGVSRQKSVYLEQSILCVKCSVLILDCLKLLHQADQFFL